MRRRDFFSFGAAAAGAVALGAISPAASSAQDVATAHTARKSKVVTPDGVTLRVRDWGTGKPIVFLSGWGLPSAFWQYNFVDLMDAGVRCISYDRRGHGRSDDPGAGYDYDTLARDLGAVLDQLDLRDVTLVAYSMSGGEAVRCLGTEGRARVSRVVFLSSTAPCLMLSDTNTMGVPGAMLEGAKAMMAQDFPKWLKDGESAFWLNAVSEGMQEWGRELMLQTSLLALLECYDSMIHADLRGELKALDLPVLVIHGDKDASAPLPLSGARIAELVPGASLKVYAGAPHGLPITHRKQFNADLLAFVRG
ncbi:alpha/beta fold hydrolase [Kordiimonas sp.]|uniref:alpha/beta fold hydrolase n=1 Tax=Kordiimonas sp. TaxID=1970157 RepID=UPI003A8E60C1